MTSQGLLLFSIGIGIVLVGSFLYGRRAVRQPTKLNLRAHESGGPQTPVQQTAPNVGVQTIDPATRSSAGLGTNEKVLNVVFMYNGHSWDAHEVLGLPAGAGQQALEEAYQRMLHKSGPESKSFLEAAYAAIKTEFKKKK